MKTVFVILGLAAVLCLPVCVRDTVVLAEGPRDSRENVTVQVGASAGDDNPVEEGEPCCFYLLGDATGDRLIDWKDMHFVASVYNTARGEDGYDHRADVNCDGRIGPADMLLIDLMICAAR